MLHFPLLCYILRVDWPSENVDKIGRKVEFR